MQTIIDPTVSTARVVPTPSPRRAPRQPSLHGLRVGLLENTKRNAAALLGDLGEILADRHGAGRLVARTKRPFALPLSDELLHELTAECDVVVIGVGDCGSCSAAAIADGVALEQAGIPTAVICTDAFATTAQAMADLKGDGGFPYLLTAHPVANLSADELGVRAHELADAVAARMTDAAGPVADAAARMTDSAGPAA
nr:UGSC family (seleno)protein [Microbacterium bovistercoris]